MKKTIYYAEATYGEEERAKVLEVFDGKWLSGGKYSQEFEEKLAKWWGVKYAVAVNSGSSANFIAVQALGLEKGSEVITTAMAFPTTVSAILYHSLEPVYVDCDIPQYTIKLDEIEQAITDKTKALFFAHTLGNMCDMDKLMAIVKKHNLKLIEDSCDATGSTWKGQKLGTFGDMATVSFYPAHHMTTFGEGGAILTNDYALYRKCKSIRDWGRACWCRWDEAAACGNRFVNPPFDHKYFYINLGMNLKMTEAQAAFGVVQLDRLDGFISKRRENFATLIKYTDSDKYILPTYLPDADPSWFAFPITLKNQNRKEFVENLESKGIQTRSLFAGNITAHPAYRNTGRIASSLVNSNTVLNRTFFVGLGPKLNEDDMKYITSVLNN